jgi:hypothetical protein
MCPSLVEISQEGLNLKKTCREVKKCWELRKKEERTAFQRFLRRDHSERDCCQ